jgi:hypothetical protein
MPDFGSFRGFGEKLAQGQTPTQLGLIGSNNFGFDSDTNAFILRVTNAGGSLTSNEENAVDILVKKLKTDGIWNLTKTIYPMVGASAAACAQNLKSSSFTGVFNGGWTFASSGVRGNGSTGYMSTGFIPSSNYSTLDAHVSFYTTTNAAGGFDLGGDDFPLQFSFSAKFSINNFAYVRMGSQTVASITDSNGHFVITQNASLGMRGFRNNSSYISGSFNSGISTRAVEIGCVNDSGTRQYFSNREYNFVSIGDGLTNAQASDFYTAVQAFQTTLGRQV